MKRILFLGSIMITMLACSKEEIQEPSIPMPDDGLSTIEEVIAGESYKQYRIDQIAKTNEQFSLLLPNYLYDDVLTFSREGNLIIETGEIKRSETEPDSLFYRWTYIDYLENEMFDLGFPALDYLVMIDKDRISTFRMSNSSSGLNIVTTNNSVPFYLMPDSLSVRDTITISLEER